MSAFGVKVKELLAGRDASWLHERTGIANSTISNWFDNPHVQPKPSSVAKVAKAFGVTIDDLAPAAGYMIRASIDGDERLARRSAIIDARPRLAESIDRIEALSAHEEDTLLSMIEAYLATLRRQPPPEEQ